MEILNTTIEEIILQFRNFISSLDKDSTEEFIRLILGARRIFLVGAGRSGLVARAFAMRLMHLGKKVFVIGETITPPVEKDDLVIALTGSGKTKSVVSVAKISKKLGAKVALITANRRAPIRRYCDVVIKIKAKTKETRQDDYITRELSGEFRYTVLGTMFELTAMIFLEGIISELMDRLALTERDLKKRHANLE